MTDSKAMYEKWLAEGSLSPTLVAERLRAELQDSRRTCEQMREQIADLKKSRWVAWHEGLVSGLSDAPGGNPYLVDVVTDKSNA